jgi:hypothetical protein
MSMDFLYPTPLTIVLEKKSSSGNWIPYQIIPQYQGDWPNDGNEYFDVSTNMNAGTFYAAGGSNNPQTSMVIHTVLSDPRTMRFGFSGTGVGNSFIAASNGFKPMNGTTPLTGYLGLNSGGTFTIGSPFSGSPVAPAAYASNSSSGNSYTDPDGTTRQGDSGTAGDNPYTSSTAQPSMLSRPLASVAELGYAFRDDPWRTLDFFSASSADGGLLDLFSATENDNATRAGVVDINNASVPVLTALLTGAYRDPLNPTTPADELSSSQAATIAQAIRTQLGTPGSPSYVLRNVSDLPVLISKITASLPDNFKYGQEAVTRSLADVCNTRTWDLMIDVIAQSGRYTSTSTNLNNFVVDGERRYWVHVAIDRFTGKVVARQVEPVSE